MALASSAGNLAARATARIHELTRLEFAKEFGVSIAARALARRFIVGSETEPGEVFADAVFVCRFAPSPIVVFDA